MSFYGVKIISYFKSLAPDKRLGLVTNGELLDKFDFTDILQSNVDSLRVSLNAHSKQMYESINAGLDYNRVMSNISTLLLNNPTREKTTLTLHLLSKMRMRCMRQYDIGMKRESGP